MKDNLENFKQISDEILEDIYVTDELERKTLEKCNNKRFFKLNPLIVSTVSAAALIVTFGIYNHFSHNTNVAYNSVKHEDKSTIKKNKDLPKIAENNKVDDSKDLALNNEKKHNSEAQNKNLNSNTITENSNLTTNTNTIIKKADTTSQSSNGTNNKPLNPSKDTSKDQMNAKKDVDKDIDRSVPERANLSCSERPLDIETAENYFEGKILLPSYVPQGFALTNISIPDHNEKCVKLSYSSDSSYFEILQSKNLSNLKEDKIISVGNNKAYESQNDTDTKISWISSDIQYTLSGNLPENSLIDIAKSIK
ncbi:hypothetical protein Ccar_10055 [Clostridium carboxidivorans P7]|uniref:DUF4367 domain-containing protein n=1 Tax=Clostridium carboxidivorans P7 TaxID=536227 RepID=C6PY58_9CLOT|nr:DUF4367 domain-containing protein [Clostridium carboxidivorans]AKN31173.1 hypothetical protein Ccar_10055 [Clostridium carboxidivorans P7]EET85846.1 hypothetical protein CcarbDRAFT_3725 [Clostridium carboxidivorans P7]EFG88286.1 hypothetical protein CLCAR_1860 [Clostridium carboxidivorans P7]